jgi:hypothetical protein
MRETESSMCRRLVTSEGGGGSGCMGGGGDGGCGPPLTTSSSREERACDCIGWEKLGFVNQTPVRVQSTAGEKEHATKPSNELIERGDMAAAAGVGGREGVSSRGRKVTVRY